MVLKSSSKVITSPARHFENHSNRLARKTVQCHVKLHGKAEILYAFTAVLAYVTALLHERRQSGP